MLETLQIRTPDHSTTVDITELVARVVQESGVKSGICTLYVPHTTAAVMVNEGDDPAVMQDVLSVLDRLVPWRQNYRHAEGNAAAHIKAILVGGAKSVIVNEGRLLLGTWERVFLCEFDGPRTRKVRIKVIEG